MQLFFFFFFFGFFDFFGECWVVFPPLIFRGVVSEPKTPLILFFLLFGLKGFQIE